MARPGWVRVWIKIVFLLVIARMKTFAMTTKENEFIELCYNGNLDLCKEFYVSNPNINISAGDEDSFRYACLCGHLNVVKWLLKIKPDINISAKNERAFRWACQSGNLKTVKWLLEIKPDINISAENESAFSEACAYGHLDIAKWLLKIKPDINVGAGGNDYPFKWARLDEYLSVAEFLMHLVPYYNLKANYKQGGRIKNISQVTGLWDLL